MQYDIIITGAGAAGLMCAAQAGRRGRKVLLIDHAKSAGEKIRISGGGRCNFTNIHASPDNFLSQNPRFCVSALKRYSQHDFIKLVEKYNIAYHEKTLGQLFCDGSSKQIIDMLLAECSDAKVAIMQKTGVDKITKADDGFEIETNNGNFSAASLVIATGGPSIPKMGASGWGYKVAEQFGLKIIEPRAALVPLTLDGRTYEKLQALSGISLDITASSGGVTFREAMLFTHRGLSGPAILQISSYWKEGEKVTINLLPDLDILQEMKQIRQSSPKQELAGALAAFLPKRLAQYIVGEYGHQGNMADLSNKHLQEIADNIHKWQIMPNGTEGFRTAEVTLGGVDTDELSSKTFEAKKVKGLYFIGEVVDVTGHLGGFNFQWAWSSGYAAGEWV